MLRSFPAADLMGRLWKREITRTARYSIIEKYEIPLEINGKQELDRSTNPYQDAKLLVELRNALIHYEPYTVLASSTGKTEPALVHKFKKRFKGKFALNPLTGPGNAFYPQKLLGHGCALWTIKTALAFSDAFYDALGVEPKYSQIRPNFDATKSSEIYINLLGTIHTYRTTQLIDHMVSTQEKKKVSDEKLKMLNDAIEDFSAFRMALSRESDRGCALFAAAYIDKALGDLLKACMVQHRKLDEELFVGQNPLSSFSSRIKLAYYLGKIAPSERKDLDTIRSIRNEFAHHANLLSFEDQSIRDRCNNLAHNWREKEASARTKFNATVSALLIRIVTERITSTAATEGHEKPLPDHIKEKGRQLWAKLNQPPQSNPSTNGEGDASRSEI